MWKSVVWASLWSVICVGIAVAVLPHSHDLLWDRLLIALSGFIAVLEWIRVARRRSARRP